MNQKLESIVFIDHNCCTAHNREEGETMVNGVRRKGVKQGNSSRETRYLQRRRIDRGGSDVDENDNEHSEKEMDDDLMEPYRRSHGNGNINDDDVVMVEPKSTHEEKRQEERSKQRAWYDEGKGVPMCKNVARDVRCCVRDYLVSKVKFVDAGNKKTFPSFLLHDFTDSKHFLTRFVNENLNFAEDTLEKKVEFWITYGKVVKKEVSNHRATCACAMKDAFLAGKKRVRLFAYAQY